MKADQRVVDFLLGHDKIDNRLLAFTRRVDPLHCWSDLALPEGLIVQLTHATQSLEGAGGIFFFHGPYGVGKQAAAEAICAELELPLLVADLGQALVSDLSPATTVALLRREARLQGAGLYLAHFEALLADGPQGPSQVMALAHALARPGFPVFLGSEIRWHPAGLWPETCFLSFDLPLPAFPLRLRLWDQALRSNGHQLGADTDVAAVANEFVLSAGQIQDAAREAGHLTAVRAADQRDISTDDLHAAARAQSNQGLRRLAQKIEPIYTWSDIVLPRRAMQQLHEVYASVKYRHVVYSCWGFDRKLSLGKGLNALFSGPSGTGKTMAAQILARELNLDLYKIDLSSVVSKYIGETEKNLDRIFREAQASNAILFFDEADALFGKRSEVKDAHDRYANIEVAYLLQKMEEYDGITILATNLRKNMDEAFTRRLHHIVEFPFPDQAHRERIWQGMFPAETPLVGDVDFGFLARQFELTGGNIRNVALAAAFMAAEDGGAIRMEQLILATARELQKMGKLPSKADFRDYYELIRERG
jgi:SpoVK/Ycf46/Vps4 family AAA+-type ATPase